MAVALCAAQLLLASAGCSAFRASAKADRLQAALDAVPVELPLEELWPRARHLLAERGCALAGQDAEAEGQTSVDLLGYLSRARETAPTQAGGRRLETGWDARRVRYVAEAIPDGGGWRVHFTAIHEHLTEHGHDGHRRRDPELELEFLRRVAPERASAVTERTKE